MDKTALYWRKSPSKGLSSAAMPGRKIDKSRISIALCTNATGTDQSKPWFIGKAKTPRALKGISFDTMGVVWRHNTKAGMTTTVMSEWLHQFYNNVNSLREVLLTLDNCSAHVAAVAATKPPPHIRICWLPLNATSQYQPLDQGIIAAYKAHYHQQWLSYMVECYQQDSDPVRSMNLHLALRWSVRAWCNNVSNTTIINCFSKSTITPSATALLEPAPLLLEELYCNVQGAGEIRDALPIDGFLYPPEEEENVDMPSLEPPELLSNLIEDHLAATTSCEENEEDNSLPPTVPKTTKEALQALSTIVSYAESEPRMTSTELRQLENLQQRLSTWVAEGRVQNTLDSWLS